MYEGTIDLSSQQGLLKLEALLLHGETRPMTDLPARATSAASDVS
jgi:hypothetical protein